MKKTLFFLSFIASFSASAVSEPVQMQDLNLERNKKDLKLNPYPREMGNSHQIGTAGPVEVHVQCEGVRCEQGIFHFRYGKSIVTTDPLSCSYTPCGPDIVQWHPNTRLISISLKNSELFLLKAVYSKELKEKTDMVAKDQFDRKGPLVALGTGFFSVQDSSNTVVALPRRTGLSWSEYYRVGEAGLLTVDKEQTCNQSEKWFNSKRNSLEEVALGIQSSPVNKKRKSSLENSEDRAFLEMGEYCNSPISTMAKKEAEKWISDKPRHILDSKEFWNPVSR
ncbi:MAG TPA: hypothetical protein VIY47_08190 [Ignavibacteriaceae bacterium]